MRCNPPEVVVVAYGPVSPLAHALAALGGGVIVHVVDNGLSDDVAALVQRLGFDYVRPSRNVGFAAAVNLGLQRCDAGQDVLLLNPDARISGADVLLLQERLRRNARSAAVAPRLSRPDGSTERTRWPMPSPWQPWRGILGCGGLRPNAAFFLSGAVLLLRGEALKDVGIFDERFFLYAEETDWQRRALAKGWLVAEVPEVQAEHLGAGSSSDGLLREEQFHRSGELFIRKWHGRPGWVIFRLGALLAAARRFATARDPAARRRASLTCRIYLTGPSARLPDDAQALHDS